MNTWQASAKAVAIVAIALGGVLFVTKDTAFAQRVPGSIQRRVDRLSRQGEQFERDNLGREVNRSERRRPHALLADVRKDLETLQADYNKIVLAMAANKSADDDQILHAVGEINACAARLKHNLALPQPADDKSKALEPTTASQSTEPALMSLRKHIYNFVMNPLFESPAVLDVEQAKNASRDLDKIIEVSELISKHHGRRKSSN